jgi:hypothetical protein
MPPAPLDRQIASEILGFPSLRPLEDPLAARAGVVAVADETAADRGRENRPQILMRDPADNARPHPPAIATPPSDSPPGGATIERALSDALSLIDNALSEHRRTGGERAVSELPDDDEDVALAARRLVHGARRELICVGTPGRLTHGPLRSAVDALRTLPAGDAMTRVLFPVRGGEDRHRIRMLLAGDTRNECRITQARLQEMLLADRHTGLLITQFEPGQCQTLIIRSRAVVKALHALFSQSWESAAPLLPVSLLDDPRQRETTRQILASLSEGQKDDVAARELGISVRTYRRYVADFMRDINATSRFQAGVRAAQLQLLPTP